MKMEFVFGSINSINQFFHLLRSNQGKIIILKKSNVSLKLKRMNRRLVAADSSGLINCFEFLDANQIRWKWNVQLPDPIFSSPTLTDNGQMFVGCCNGFLYAFDSSGNQVSQTFDRLF